MAKRRWVSVVLVLAFVGLPVLAQAESHSAEQAGASRQETVTASGQATAPAPMGRVARASFTSEIVAREPQDTITSLSNESTRIIFFTEIHAAQGQTVFHVWERAGTEMARVRFDVGGPRWRVYSTKNLEPAWLGRWTVRVEDADGRELHSDGFSYVSTATTTGAEKTSEAAQELPPVSEPYGTPEQQLPASAPID